MQLIILLFRNLFLKTQYNKTIKLKREREKLMKKLVFESVNKYNNFRFTNLVYKYVNIICGVVIFKYNIIRHRSILLSRIKFVIDRLLFLLLLLVKKKNLIYISLNTLADNLCSFLFVCLIMLYKEQ